MTNYEKLQKSSIDELADLIEKLDTYGDIANSKFCYEVCPARNKEGGCNSDDQSLYCDSLTERECILAWLKNEVAE